MTDPMTPERPHAAVLRIHENYRRGAPAAAGDVIALIGYTEAAEAEIGRLNAEVDRLRTQVAANVEELLRHECAFFACGGADAPFEDMVTCWICALIQQNRAALASDERPDRD